MNGKILFVFLIAATSFPVSGLSASMEERIRGSREVVNQFASELKSHLKSALKEGGASRAIRVCSEIAPATSARFSHRTGWRVGRTSLKFRNPDNIPRKWEKKVLQRFHEQRRQEIPAEQMQFYEVVDVAGKKYFRYMKAIETREICLTCHGSQLSQEIRKVLNQIYPQDRARGFAVGDIRGAFSIVQPMVVPMKK